MRHYVRVNRGKDGVPRILGYNLLSGSSWGAGIGLGDNVESDQGDTQHKG
jgi:hypothetical protein